MFQLKSQELIVIQVVKCHWL